MEPTELESCVLGLVWERGPCTAYAIRKVFVDSASSYWSGSAGAIYPLVARLEARGLLAARLEPWAKRSKKELVLTPAGLEALRSWLLPVPAWAGSAVVDPIRTRTFFLGALAPERWGAFFAEAEKRTRERLAAVHAECAMLEREGERMNLLASRGAIYELEARLAWLAELRRELAAKRTG